MGRISAKSVAGELVLDNPADVTIIIEGPKQDRLDSVQGNGLARSLPISGNPGNATFLNRSAQEDTLSLTIEGAVPIAQGKFLIKERKESGVNAALTGGNVEMLLGNSVWFKEAKRARLSDFMPDDIHVQNWTNCLARMEGQNFNSDSTFFAYYAALSDSFRNQVEVLTPDVDTGISQEVDRLNRPVLWVEDLSFCFFIKPILTKFFRSLGYRVESNFLSSYNGQRAAIGINPRAATYTKKYQDESRIEAVDIELHPTVYPVTETSGTITEVRNYKLLKFNAFIQYGIFELTGTNRGIRSTHRSLYRPEVWVKNADGETAVAAIWIETYGGSYIPYRQYYADGNTILRLTGGTDTPTSSDNYAMAFAVREDFGPITEASLKIWPDWYPGHLASVNPRHLLPDDWTIDKLVIGLSHALNLAWDTDTGRKVVSFDPLHGGQFTNRSGGTNNTVSIADWFSSTIDLSNVATAGDVTVTKPDVVDETERNSILIGYTSNAPTWEAYQKGREVPQQAVLLNRQGRESDQQLNPFFKGVIHAKYPFPVENGGPPPQMPLYVNSAWPVVRMYGIDDRAGFSYQEPQLLHYEGRRGGLDGWMLRRSTLDPIANEVTLTYEDNPSAVPYTWVALPVAFSINYNDSTGFDPCYSYSDVALDTGITVEGLFNRLLWRRYAAIRNADTWSIPMYFPLYVWLTLKARQMVHWRGRTITPEQITYTPETNTALVKGKQITYPSADDLQEVTMGG